MLKNLDHLVNSHLSFSPGYRGVHLDTSSVSPDSHSVSTARIQGSIHSYSVHSHHTPGFTPQDTVLSAPKSILWYYISTPLPSSICLLNYALFNGHFSWEYHRYVSSISGERCMIQNNNQEKLFLFFIFFDFPVL